MDTSDVILRGRRNTLDVWRCDFCANRIVRAASTAENVQIPWKVLRFGQVMNIDGSLARNIDFDVANFALHEKTCRKTLIFQVQSVKSGGSLVRNARFELSTCLVLTLWFCGGVPVPKRKAAKLVFCVRFKGCGNGVLRGRRGAS